MVRINKIILTINQFIQRITMRYSKDKSIYPYCILIYAKDKLRERACAALCLQYDASVGTLPICAALA